MGKGQPFLFIFVNITMETIKDNLEVYSIGRSWSFIYTQGENVFEGDIHIKTMEHGGEDYECVDYLEWEYGVEPENAEEIEKYVDENLWDLIK